VEFHFEEPEPAPAPLGGLVEVHMDPETGENERFNPAGPFADIPASEREVLPRSALPAGWEDTPRNSACPCGSGKKFKHCHGSF
jgi:preprotein translocase subunit SecA